MVSVLTNPNTNPSQPSPVNTDPQQNVEAPRKLSSRLAGLAITGAAGYALHKGFQTSPLDFVTESIGETGADVLEVAVISSSLAVTGLREQIAGRREKRTHKKLRQVRGAVDETNTEVSLLKRSYDLIVNGARPETWSDEHLTPVPNIEGSNVPKRHRKHLAKLDDARDGIRELTHANNFVSDLYGKSRIVADGKGGTLKQSDFDTPEHHARMRAGPPRTQKQKTGEMKAVLKYRERKQKIEDMSREAYSETLGKEVRRLEHLQRKQAKLGRKHEKRASRLNSIRSRDDFASKIYDKSVEQSKAAIKVGGRSVKRGGKFAVRTSREGVKAMGRQVHRSAHGIVTSPAAFIEGQQGINVPDTIQQRALDKIARVAGRGYGKGKHSAQSRLGKIKTRKSRK